MIDIYNNQNRTHKLVNRKEQIEAALLEIAKSEAASLLLEFIQPYLSDNYTSPFMDKLLKRMINQIPDQMNESLLISFFFQKFNSDKDSAKYYKYFLLFSQKANFELNQDIISYLYQVCRNKQQFWHLVCVANLSTDGKQALINIAHCLSPNHYKYALEFVKNLHDPNLSSHFFISSIDSTPFECLLSDISSPSLATSLLSNVLSLPKKENKNTIKRAINHMINIIYEWEGGIDVTLFSIARHHPENKSNFITIYFGPFPLVVYEKISLSKLERLYHSHVVGDLPPLYNEIEIPIALDPKTPSNNNNNNQNNEDEFMEDEEIQLDTNLLPTMLLNSQGIQDKLLKEVIDIPETIKLLNLLPTSLTLLEKIEKGKPFLDELQTLENPILYKYYMESLSESIKEDTFLAAEGPKIIQNISKHFSKEYQSELFNVLLKFADNVNQDTLLLCLDTFCDQNLQSELRNSALSLIIKCISIPQLLDIIMNLIQNNNNNYLYKILLSLSDLTWNNFVNFFNAIPENKNEIIVSFCLDILKEITTNNQSPLRIQLRYVIELLKISLNKVKNNKLDMNVMNSCVILLQDQKTTVSALELLDATLQYDSKLLSMIALNYDVIAALINIALRNYDNRALQILKKIIIQEPYNPNPNPNIPINFHFNPDTDNIDPNLIQEKKINFIVQKSILILKQMSCDSRYISKTISLSNTINYNQNSQNDQSNINNSSIIENSRLREGDEQLEPKIDHPEQKLKKKKIEKEQLQIPGEMQEYTTETITEMAAPKMYSGLINHGANCYVNSVLQQLYNCAPFFSSVTQNNSNSETDSNTNSNSETNSNDNSNSENDNPLKKLFLDMTLGGIKDPLPLCRSLISPDFDPLVEEDAAEFLEKLCSLLPQTIQETITGQIKSQIDRLDGSFLTESLEPFVALPIVVQNSSSIEQSLSRLFSPERLEGENRYDDGHEKVDAIRHPYLSKTPNILCLHLMRFQYDPMYQRIKINDAFDFPTVLNIHNTLFDLSGVIFHHGTPYSGHYTSAVRRFDSNPTDQNLNQNLSQNLNQNQGQIQSLNQKGNDSWIYINDTSISEISQEDVMKYGRGGSDYAPSAYLLFYVKRESIPYSHLPPNMRPHDNIITNLPKPTLEPKAPAVNVIVQKEIPNSIIEFALNLNSSEFATALCCYAHTVPHQLAHFFGYNNRTDFTDLSPELSIAMINRLFQNSDDLNSPDLIEDACVYSLRLIESGNKMKGSSKSYSQIEEERKRLEENRQFLVNNRAGINILNALIQYYTAYSTNSDLSLFKETNFTNSFRFLKNLKDRITLEEFTMFYTNFHIYLTLSEKHMIALVDLTTECWKEGLINPDIMFQDFGLNTNYTSELISEIIDKGSGESAFFLNNLTPQLIDYMTNRILSGYIRLAVRFAYGMEQFIQPILLDSSLQNREKGKNLVSAIFHLNIPNIQTQIFEQLIKMIKSISNSRIINELGTNATSPRMVQLVTLVGTVTKELKKESIAIENLKKLAEITFSQLDNDENYQAIQNVINMLSK